MTTTERLSYSYYHKHCMPNYDGDYNCRMKRDAEAKYYSCFFVVEERYERMNKWPHHRYIEHLYINLIDYSKH